jgi:hypothetical protein
MINSLIPLLKTHRLDFRTEIKDSNLHIYVIPKVLNDKLDEKDQQVLERPLFKSYPLSEYSDEALIADIHHYSNVLIEGTTAIEDIESEIKKRVAEKKKPATKRATNGKAKPAPRKTKKQEMDEARAKQAKEREGQANLFDEDEDRLGEKTPVKNKAELKTAAEKAVERVTQKPTAEEEAEAIATAVETKEEDEESGIEVAEAREGKITDEDPFGLDDLEVL